MQKKHRILWFVPVGICFVAGCDSPAKTVTASDARLQVMQAPFTAVPIAVDGKLDDPVWAAAPRYRMSLSRDRLDAGEQLEDGGSVRLAWDEKYLYLAVELIDRDVVADSDEDDQMHFLLGDVAELFIKPQDHVHYWELYVTPRGRKTTIFFPQGGPDNAENLIQPGSGLRVAAMVKGTLNKRTDVDEKWTAEMAMPVAQLIEHGAEFGPGTKWRVFIGRYNYVAHRTKDDPELSMTPALPQTNYHLIEHYAVLKLMR